MTRVSKHFTYKELRCPSTGQMVLADGFIESLEKLRVSYGSPMTINSGCRTLEHNQNLLDRGYSASPNSFHLIGNEKYGTNTCAVDVANHHKVKEALHKYPELKQYIKFIVTSAMQGWSIGVAESFTHIDKRSEYTSKPQTLYFYG